MMLASWIFENLGKYTKIMNNAAYRIEPNKCTMHITFKWLSW